MSPPDASDPQARTRRAELSGFMRWWRGIGLGFVLLALLLFSREQDELGYAALAVGWAIMIYAIVTRTRLNRAQMREESVERD